MSIIHCENNLSPRLRALFARFLPRAPFPLVRASEIGYPPGVSKEGPHARASCVRVTRACVARAGGGRVRVMRAGGARARVVRARRALGGVRVGGRRARAGPRAGGGGALRCGRRGGGGYRGDGGLPEHGTPSSRPRAPTAGGWAQARRGRAGRAARSLGRRGRAAGRGRLGAAWACWCRACGAWAAHGLVSLRRGSIVRAALPPVRPGAELGAAGRLPVRRDLRLCRLGASRAKKFSKYFSRI